MKRAFNLTATALILALFGTVGCATHVSDGKGKDTTLPYSKSGSDIEADR